MKRTLFWLPRLLAVLFILFLSLFALDVFDGQSPLWKILIGFFIHLIPSFILVGVLIIAWKKEKIGGLLFILTAIILVIIVRGDVTVKLILSLPPFFIGILLLSYHYRYKN